MELEESGGTPVGGGFITHIPTILWQRRWFVVIPLILMSIAGAATALFLPATYRSTAVLLVESQQLPAELVGNAFTDVVDKRIAKIRQQILSRADLIEIIQSNNLYAYERQSEPLSTVVSDMRDATIIAPVSADIQAEQNKSNTIAFSLSFDYEDPARAQLVAQEFVDRLLRLDAEQTTEQAKSTVDFLQQQSDKLSVQINEIEGQIQGIKRSNGIALSTMTPMIMSQGSYEPQIAELRRENARIAAQIAQMTGPAAKDPIVTAAEAQLAAAKAVYADTHPDVRLAEQRLAEARRFAKANSQTAANADSLRAQIAANDNAIGLLMQSRAADQARSATALSAQARAPGVLEQIAQLQAKADGLRTNYESVSTKLMSAQSSARMGAEQKAERLSLIDPPVVPDEPHWPNRWLLAGGGAGAGLALGLILAFAYEFLKRPIRGAGGVVSATGAEPLVVIPTLDFADVRRRFRWPGLPSWFRRKPAEAQ